MSKDNILGISLVGDSGVALFQDGELRLAVNEERFTRIKLDGSYPEKSIDWCLQEAKLFPQDIDLICFGFTNGMKQGKFVQDMIHRMQSYSEDKDAMKIIHERVSTEAEIDRKIKNKFIKKTNNIFPDIPIYFCHHHESHQACALMSSPFRDTLILTSDGRGDFLSITLSEARDGVLTKLLYQNYSWESLGYFYGRITHLCGFRSQRHEGKITGLAAKGDPEVAISLMKKMIDFDGSHVVAYPGDYYRPFFSNYSKRLREEASKFSREDLAAAAQKHLENMVSGLVSKYTRQTNLKNICLAGGVFANVKLNQRISDLAEIDDVFIYPNMGDGGLCTGSVYHYFMTREKRKSRPLNSMYLGPAINNLELEQVLKKERLEVKKYENVNKIVIEILSSEKTIGLVQGRAEFGPRALGNRSILGACSSKNFCDSINKRLGRTEFMPFAPAIASDLAPLCLKNFNQHFSARHMTITYNVTEEFMKNSPAVVHDDGTVRPQIVYKKDNPYFYSLLMDWFKITGGLCLINTSFNLHEDPIVTTVNDVVLTFMNNAVDYLLFPPYLCKYRQPIIKNYLKKIENTEKQKEINLS